MEFSLGKVRFAAIILQIFACLAGHEALATDFADPGDTMIYLQKQKAGHSSYPEIDGTIESTSTAKPGWYGVVLKLDNGKSIRVIVVPATKFYKDYAPVSSPDAYHLLVKGCKIRALHNPDQDEVLRNIIVTDLMFTTPPVELAGTIKGETSAGAGAYDLTVDLADGSERHLNVDQKTKFWKNYKPLDPFAAYPQLTAGQKFRAMDTAAPGNQRHISDLMFVDP